MFGVYDNLICISSKYDFASLIFDEMLAKLLHKAIS